MFLTTSGGSSLLLASQQLLTGFRPIHIFWVYSITCLRSGDVLCRISCIFSRFFQNLTGRRTLLPTTHPSIQGCPQPNSSRATPARRTDQDSLFLQSACCEAFTITYDHPRVHEMSTHSPPPSSCGCYACPSLPCLAFAALRAAVL